MKCLDLSIIVKTFLRPECLENFLASIQEYQNHFNISFSKIIIVDDGDKNSQLINQKIIQQYKDLNAEYLQYEFDLLGASKGRNIAINLVKTPYFLICDDDFILDTECDIASSLEILKEKNLDILGGYYKNIENINSKVSVISNWLGFILEKDNTDICIIYEDIIPEFCECDIVQQFCLAKTESIKCLLYPEDIPTNEHNIFFLKIKQKGLKVAFTNQLWVKHFRLSNKEFNKYRYRKVANQINKNVLGYLVSKDRIIHFNDYINMNGTEFCIKKDSGFSIKLNLLFAKIEINCILSPKIVKFLEILSKKKFN